MRCITYLGKLVRVLCTKGIMHPFFLNFGLANNFKIYLKKKKHGIKHFKNS